MNCWERYSDEQLIARALEFADPDHPDHVEYVYREMFSELARRLGRRDEEAEDTKGCPENEESRDNWTGSPGEELYLLRSKRVFKAPSPIAFEPLDAYVARVVQALEDHVNGQA